MLSQGTARCFSFVSFRGPFRVKKKFVFDVHETNDVSDYEDFNTSPVCGNTSATINNK